jgi:anti-sigma-K factor RskA
VVSLSDVNGHGDLGAYALGRLSDAEAVRFEAHLAVCAACRGELKELEPVGALLRVVAPPIEPRGDLERRVLLGVERAARMEDASAKPPRRRWRLSLAFAGAGAAIALGAAVLLLALRGPVEVRKTGIGRVIAFESDSLPILPKGEYYELWFVGPGDAPGRPNRISAGTFHPDERGRSHVRFAAAVDPAKYRVLSVTAEPGDGDPRATGPEVLRSRR